LGLKADNCADKNMFYGSFMQPSHHYNDKPGADIDFLLIGMQNKPSLRGFAFPTRSVYFVAPETYARILFALPTSAILQISIACARSIRFGARNQGACK